MLSTSNSLKFLCAVFIISMVFAAATAQAATKVKGTLYSLNRTANSVTLKTNGILTTIQLSATTKLLRNKVATNLNGMVLGDKMTVVFRSTLFPAKVKAKGPSFSQVQGKVTAISPSGMVQIGATSFQVTAHTLISRNGKPASLDDIAGDDDLVAHIDDHSGEAEDIHGEGPENAEAKGTITVVDVPNNTVTFQDANSNIVTVNVTSGTMIEVGDAAATISDLTAGMLVEVHYDPSTFEAFRIEAELEGEDAEIDGTVTAVDLVNATVTIRDALGTSVTVIADAGTMIERDGEPAFLSDIQVGDSGKAEYDATSFIANEINVTSTP